MADAKRSEITYEVGNWVYLKLQPYHQYFVTLIRNHKLNMKYFSPFWVLPRIDLVAYKLSLPVEAHIYIYIYPIFHASLSKKFYCNLQSLAIPLTLLTQSMDR